MQCYSQRNDVIVTGLVLLTIILSFCCSAEASYYTGKYDQRDDQSVIASNMSMGMAQYGWVYVVSVMPYVILRCGKETSGSPVASS